jgi:hypothetical protein
LENLKELYNFGDKDRWDDIKINANGIGYDCGMDSFTSGRGDP